MNNINEHIHNLPPYSAGKPIEALQREQGLADVIKLGSNENAFGCSSKVTEGISQLSTDWSRYPDPDGYALKSALAARFGVDLNHIALGNGSSEVLEFAARIALSPGSEAVVDQYCFTSYLPAIEAAHGDVVQVPSKDWKIDLERMLDYVNDKTRLIFLTNPCNPTGVWHPGTDIRKFLDSVPPHVWVVFDEAYWGFFFPADYPDCVQLTKDYPNLILTRTFSKVYGLAGLRVGYAICSTEMCNYMNRIRSPFNVNRVALLAAELALDDDEFVQYTAKLNADGMAYLTGEFDRLGIAYIPSITNFVTFDCGQDAREIDQALLSKGVIIRTLRNYELPNHLRVTVGTSTENERFISCLESVL